MARPGRLNEQPLSLFIYLSLFLHSFGESGILPGSACACILLPFTVLEWSMIRPDESGNHESLMQSQCLGSYFFQEPSDFLRLSHSRRYPHLGPTANRTFSRHIFLTFCGPFFLGRLFTQLWWIFFPWTFSPIVDLFCVDLFTYFIYLFIYLFINQPIAHT